MIDTIAAISTSSLPSAIGIIRISGSKVLAIASEILYKDDKKLEQNFILKNKRKVIFCELRESERNKLDQIIYFYFESPHSYTGEDMLELHLHGNPILLKSALHLAFQKGARPASQGELTKRALLNNKIDISTTEAISRLISSRSKFELELAQKNIFGEIYKLTARVRSDLINLKAECEAEIDFSTEDLTFESREVRLNHIIELQNKLNKLLSNSSIAEKIIESSKIVIYGAPNTGKSSLMNAILGKDRAIISEIPGTTRDYLAEDISIEGIPVQLVDTAGVRETTDAIEKMGIERSEREFQSANIKLFLIDTSIELDINKFILDNTSKLNDSIIVANKIDIEHTTWKKQKNNFPNNISICEISCKKNIGINLLLKMIAERIHKIDHEEDYILLEDRNKAHFQKIFENLSRTILLMKENAPAEVYIKEIDDSLVFIGMVNGKIENEEILGRIFSKFCIGK